MRRHKKQWKLKCGLLVAKTFSQRDHNQRPIKVNVRKLT